MEISNSETLVALELKIASDKLAKFKGTARVSITHLDFPHPTRQIDEKIVRQLVRDFEGEGCIREEPSHRIPAVIEDSMLEEALEKIPLSAEAFKARVDNPPILKLRSGAKLECLHGQHRVLAAKEHLSASQWWWVVDIYGSNLDKDTKQALREGYSYSAKYTSGEIFRHMRLCHYDNDALGVQRWRGRFSDSQDQFLEQLFKRPTLVAALDSILHIQGVWRQFYIGSLDAFLFPKCDEEKVHYIKLIKTIWTRILNGNMAKMMQTDPFTIESLQSRAPALSKCDFEFVQNSMESKELFPGITDQVVRDDITQRLLTVEELIPSLYTLIKDIRYLKRPAELLVKLLPESRKKTLRQRWYHYFTDPGSSDRTIKIQRSVLGPCTTISSRHFDSFDVCYQQLWLCAYRVCKYSNAYGRLLLAELAHQLGFWNTKIQVEVAKDPAQAVIEKAFREVLHILRPNENFNFDANKARPVITSFKEYLNMLEPSPANTAYPAITVAGTGVPLLARCGHGSMDTRDLAHLFLDKIHAPLQEYKRDGDEISSFYVKRSRHIAFFGWGDLTGHHESGSPRHERRPTQLNSGNTSLERQSTSLLGPDGERTGSISARSPDQSPVESTQGNVLNQVVVYSGRMIRFMENDILLQEVPFREQDVNDQAKEYADQGRKLYVDQGAYFLWQHCFEILTRTRQSTVFVATVPQPVNGKRRWRQELPDRLQPATKDDFDFTMEDEEEDEEQL